MRTELNSAAGSHRADDAQTLHSASTKLVDTRRQIGAEQKIEKVQLQNVKSEELASPATIEKQVPTNQIAEQALEALETSKESIENARSGRYSKKAPLPKNAGSHGQKQQSMSHRAHGTTERLQPQNLNSQPPRISSNQGKVMIPLYAPQVADNPEAARVTPGNEAKVQMV